MDTEVDAVEAEGREKGERLRAVTRAQGWAAFLLVVSIFAMAVRPAPWVDLAATGAGLLCCMMGVAMAQYRYRLIGDDSNLWAAAGMFLFLVYGFHAFALGAPAALGAPGFVVSLLLMGSALIMMLMSPIRSGLFFKREVARLHRVLDGIEAELDAVDERKAEREAE